MNTIHELSRSVEQAGDMNSRAVADVVGTARAVVARFREGAEIDFLLERLAETTDMQRETAQRLALAHAALADAYREQDREAAHG